MLLAVAAASAPGPGLTEGPRLAAAYDSILHARFEEASTRLSEACPPAPAEACLVLTAALIWWQIQLDPGSRALDRDLESASRRAIAATRQWVTREPNRAEAWFYVAGAYAPLSEWRILRGERLAAARDARGIKNALERALALDGTLHDAYFGIGLYHYYADVAPTALKILRLLLLMPGGDRIEGLREMLQARDRGVLLGGEADYQMHWLYLWYEHDPARALELLQALDARYPSNPLFLQRIAEVHRDYRHDRAATLTAWQTLLERALTGRVERAEAAATLARLGIAETLIDSAEYTRALEAVAPVIAARPSAPAGSYARAQLTAARAYEPLGDRSRAIAALNLAITLAPADDPQAVRARARAALARLRSAER